MQGGVASPGLFVILSLLFVRGNKQLGLDAVQIVVADDGLVGVPRTDLKLLVEAVMRRYTEYYMDIAPGKTKQFGVGGRAGGGGEEVGGRTILVERETMQHLGAVLPLKGQVKLAKKTATKLASVHERWAQESEIL